MIGKTMCGVKGEETTGCERNSLSLRNGIGWVQWRTEEFGLEGAFTAGTFLEGSTNSVED
jgi:hypothetical protein